MITFQNKDGSPYVMPAAMPTSAVAAKLPKVLFLQDDGSGVEEFVEVELGTNLLARGLSPQSAAYQVLGEVDRAVDCSITVPAPRSGTEWFRTDVAPSLWYHIAYRDFTGWVQLVPQAQRSFEFTIITYPIPIRINTGSGTSLTAPAEISSAWLRNYFGIPEAECRLCVKLWRNDLGEVMVPLNDSRVNRAPYDSHLPSYSLVAPTLPLSSFGAFEKNVHTYIPIGGLGAVELAAFEVEPKPFAVESDVTIGGTTATLVTYSESMPPTSGRLSEEAPLSTTLGEAVYYTDIAIVGDYLYRVGGYATTGPSKNAERISLSTFVREPLAKCPKKLRGHNVVSYDGRVFTVGGLLVNGSPTDKVLEYDPNTDTWGQRTTAPIPVYYNVVNVVGNKLWIVGGYTSSGGNFNIYVYDFVADTWETHSVGFSIINTAGAAVGSDIFIFSGSLGAKVYKVDTLTAPHTPTEVADFPMPLTNHFATPIGEGQIVVAGGLIGSSFHGSVVIFNPQTFESDTIYSNNDFVRRRFAGAASREVLPGTYEAYVAGGYTTVIDNEVGRFSLSSTIRSFGNLGHADLQWNNLVISADPLNTFDFANPRAVLLPVVDVAGVTCIDAYYMSKLSNPPKPTYTAETRLKTQLPTYRYRYVFCRQISFYVTGGGYGIYSAQVASGGLQRIRGDADWALVEISRDGDNFYPSLELDTDVENDVEIFVRIHVGDRYPRAPKSGVIKLISEAI